MSTQRPELQLVLGGSGFIGQQVVRVLLRESAERARSSRRRRGLVVSASREPGRGIGMGQDGFASVAFDAVGAGAIERIIDDLAPTHVVLLTALASISDCEKYPGFARAMNSEFAGRVAQACAGVRARLVHVSTDLVFGGDTPTAEGFSEDDPTAPISEYGRTKLAGEQAVLAACPGALVVRLPLCWDEHGVGCGAGTPLLEAVRRGESPSLFTDEWRTPLHVGEAAEMLARCLRLRAHGLLHLGGPERITRYELGLSLLIASGLAPEIARTRIGAGTRAEAGLEETRPGDVCLDSSRAREQHGLAPRGVSASLREHVRPQVRT